MSVFRNGKPQPKGRKGDVRGGWPDISKVPGDGDVIVFDEDGVVQAEPVIAAASAAHRVAFERAPAGRGLAREHDGRDDRDRGAESAAQPGDAGFVTLRCIVCRTV